MKTTHRAILGALLASLTTISMHSSHALAQGELLGIPAKVHAGIALDGTVVCGIEMIEKPEQGREEALTFAMIANVRDCDRLTQSILERMNKREVALKLSRDDYTALASDDLNRDILMTTFPSATGIYVLKRELNAILDGDAESFPDESVSFSTNRCVNASAEHIADLVSEEGRSDTRMVSGSDGVIAEIQVLDNEGNTMSEWVHCESKRHRSLGHYPIHETGFCNDMTDAEEMIVAFAQVPGALELPDGRQKECRITVTEHFDL